MLQAFGKRGGPGNCRGLKRGVLERSPPPSLFMKFGGPPKGGVLTPRTPPPPPVSAPVPQGYVPNLGLSHI